MYRTLLLSLYESDPLADPEVGKAAPLLRRLVVTDVPLEQLEAQLDTGDGFFLELVEGEHLSFLDFFAFNAHSLETARAVMEALPSLPQTPEHRFARYICLQRSQSNEEPLSRKGLVIYKKTRFEQGASGLSELILSCASDPWIMTLVGYVVGKGLDALLGLVKKSVTEAESRRVLFHCGGFYRRAAKVLGCQPYELQITDLSPKKNGLYHIRFRKVDGTVYKADCRPNGAIVKLTSRKSSRPEK